jgi:hypothetical protein|tara:strand:- start:1678 stop:2175 length:498 start_codon:yes stop_codon:yes gene_type:complete
MATRVYSDIGEFEPFVAPYEAQSLYKTDVMRGPYARALTDAQVKSVGEPYTYGRALGQSMAAHRDIPAGYISGAVSSRALAGLAQEEARRRYELGKMATAMSVQKLRQDAARAMGRGLVAGVGSGLAKAETGIKKRNPNADSIWEEIFKAISIPASRTANQQGMG